MPRQGPRGQTPKHRPKAHHPGRRTGQGQHLVPAGQRVTTCGKLEHRLEEFHAQHRWAVQPPDLSKAKAKSFALPRAAG